MTLATFIQTSAHLLAGVEDSSVQAIITSPPYYGLRAYAGDQDIDWPAVEYAPMPGLPPLTVPAMRSPLGNEPTLEAYIGHLVLCLRRWREVLRDDGVCFVNLGDSFAGSGGAGGDYNDGGLRAGQPKFKAGKSNGLKPKDLMLVPARFALAAQAAGWWLRNDILAYKIAPMPESVRDRFTRAHEHIFMLTKRANYFFDMEAVREPALERPYTTWEERKAHGEPLRRGDPGQSGYVNRINTMASGPGRQPRDVIEWRPSGFSGAHFACWPEAIPEKLIRAATSERGACPHCSAPWRRVVERMGGDTEAINRPKKTAGMHSGTSTLSLSGNGSREWAERGAKVTVLGWQPSCTCPPHEPTPCTVLDPFSGSGTTAKVAVRLGRRAIGVDVSAEYLTDVTAQRFGAGVQMELV